MVYKFFDKTSAGSGFTLSNKSDFNDETLAEELHKPIIRTFKKRTVYSGFNNNILDADLADIQLISKFNRGFKI